MPFTASVHPVKIASTGDVQPERDTVRDVLHEWNSVHGARRRVLLLPVGWETDIAPEMGDHPQSILNKRILKDADLLVGIFWTRLGTPTPSYASCAFEEIEEHLAAGKPAMLYFSSAPAALDSVDPDKYRALKTFKEMATTKKEPHASAFTLLKGSPLNVRVGGPGDANMVKTMLNMLPKAKVKGPSNPFEEAQW